MAAFASSYIKTEGSQVTRAADAASMTGTNFSSWYNQAEGTLYAECVASSTATSAVASVTDGSFNNYLKLRYSTSTAVSQFIGATSGVTQWSIGLSATTVGQNARLAGAYNFNDIQAAKSGVIGAGDTSATIPVVNAIRFGVAESGAFETLNGTIKKIAYYPIRCTDAQLQGLTS